MYTNTQTRNTVTTSTPPMFTSSLSFSLLSFRRVASVTSWAESGWSYQGPTLLWRHNEWEDVPVKVILPRTSLVETGLMSWIVTVLHKLCRGFSSCICPCRCHEGGGVTLGRGAGFQRTRWPRPQRLGAETEADFYTTLKPNLIYLAIFLIIQIWQGG